MSQTLRVSQTERTKVQSTEGNDCNFIAFKQCATLTTEV